MSGDSARRPFANEGMRATGINLSATNVRHVERKRCTSAADPLPRERIGLLLLLLLLEKLWYFIARVLKLANVKMCVRNGYDGDSETERVGKAHCTETLNCHGNTLVHERSFPRIGCAKRGSSVDFCNEAVSLVRQETCYY